jgi:hypothetical protein
MGARGFGSSGGGSGGSRASGGGGSGYGSSSHGYDDFDDDVEDRHHIPASRIPKVCHHTHPPPLPRVQRCLRDRRVFMRGKYNIDTVHEPFSLKTYLFLIVQ